MRHLPEVAERGDLAARSGRHRSGGPRRDIEGAAIALRLVLALEGVECRPR